jgi:hypothetical protein
MAGVFVCVSFSPRSQQKRPEDKNTTGKGGAIRGVFWFLSDVVIVVRLRGRP